MIRPTVFAMFCLAHFLSLSYNKVWYLCGVELSYFREISKGLFYGPALFQTFYVKKKLNYGRQV
jgi:hypothetical protein